MDILEVKLAPSLVNHRGATDMWKLIDSTDRYLIVLVITGYVACSPTDIADLQRLSYK